MATKFSPRLQYKQKKIQRTIFFHSKQKARLDFERILIEFVESPDPKPHGGQHLIFIESLRHGQLGSVDSRRLTNADVGGGPGNSAAEGGGGGGGGERGPGAPWRE